MINIINDMMDQKNSIIQISLIVLGNQLSFYIEPYYSIDLICYYGDYIYIYIHIVIPSYTIIYIVEFV